MRMRFTSARLLLHVLTGDMDAAIFKDEDGKLAIIGSDGTLLGKVNTLDEFINWAREYNKQHLAHTVSECCDAVKEGT